MSLRANLDGSDNTTDESPSNFPLILLSQASDPENVTVVPRPSSKVDAERMATDIFDLHPFAPMILKRRTVTSDGRTVWAYIPEDYWKAIIRDGDELRIFRKPSEMKPEWDRVAATIIFGSWKCVMLLSDTYKATKEDILSKLTLAYPTSITATSDFSLRLIIGDMDSDGEYDTAILRHKGDTSDQWRDIIRRMKNEQKQLRLAVIMKQKTPELLETDTL